MASANLQTEQANGGVEEDITSQLEQLTISVTPTEKIIGIDIEDPDMYKNCSNPRGLVFMANYKEFKDNKYKTRIGSEKDTENLQGLFQMMGYKVLDPHVNMTAKETKEAIKKFKNHPELEKVDSCFVIIMSHGKDKEQFYTSDNSALNIMKDVVKKFTYKECPKLKGIPKVFIFQYCRGKLEDILITQKFPSAQQQKDDTPEMDDGNIGTSVANVATYTDMLIIYSTVEGYVSYRDAQGTWLMHAICNIFMKKAHDEHIVNLMNMVSQTMLNKYSDSKLQVCEVVNRGFHRHLYLNPDPLIPLLQDFQKVSESSTDDAYNVLCELVLKGSLFAVHEDRYARIEFREEDQSCFWSLRRPGTGEVTRLTMKAMERLEYHPISTLRIEDIMKVVEPCRPEVFLKLSYEGTELGCLQIRLDEQAYPRRTLLFMYLCHPSIGGPTWKGAKFTSLLHRGLQGEHTDCFNYTSWSKTQESHFPFLSTDLEPGTMPYPDYIQGQVVGRPGNDKPGFFIVTRSDPITTLIWPVIGHVVAGLEVLQDAIATCPIVESEGVGDDFPASAGYEFPVTISDCGIIRYCNP